MGNGSNQSTGVVQTVSTHYPQNQQLHRCLQGYVDRGYLTEEEAHHLNADQYRNLTDFIIRNLVNNQDCPLTFEMARNLTESQFERLSEIEIANRVIDRRLTLEEAMNLPFYEYLRLRDWIRADPSMLFL